MATGSYRSFTFSHILKLAAICSCNSRHVFITLPVCYLGSYWRRKTTKSKRAGKATTRRRKN